MALGAAVIVLLLVAALLFLCGVSFFRQSHQCDDADSSQALFVALLCWLLTAIFASVAALAAIH